MNIREIVGGLRNYSEINREERNYAAILYAALCQKGNPERFLKLLGINEPISGDFGIFFEYAFIRDLWNSIKREEAGETKKTVIRENLRISNLDRILAMSAREMNETFGVGGKVSKDFIQYPGRWSISRFNDQFTDNQDFMKVCMFKWAFNIKPDIVIHLSKDRAVCIEAKNESGEGVYPESEIDRKVFKDRNIGSIGQLNVQKYMLEDLLGLKTDFFYLIPRKRTGTSPTPVITWAEAFSTLDMREMPGFSKNMIALISKKQQS